MMPRVSVVMPVYNAEAYLPKAVGSILAQTFSNFEFIIVDDGSTDGSLGIVERYAMGDQRICVITRPNTGIVGALNDGLAAARGEYIARMDADDLCDPTRFELQIARLESEPHLVAVGSCAIAIDPDGETLGPVPVTLTHETIEANHLRGISCIYHPAVMMRAAAVRQVGGYRQGFCPAEDLDLWLRLGEVGRLANLPEPLFVWRRTLTGIVASTQVKQAAVLMRCLEDAWRRRSLPGCPPAMERSAMSVADQYRQWAWLALRHGNVATSRRYALRALAEEPLSKASWRLAACTLRGR